MILEIFGFAGLATTLLAFQLEGMKMRFGLLLGCSFFLVQAIGTVTISLIITNSLFAITHLFAIKRLTKKAK